MIQFARAVELEVSLAIYGMLEDLLWKTNLIGRGGEGGKTSSRSVFSSRAGTSVGDSVASHSLYSLPNITVSTKIDHVAMGSQNHVPTVRLTKHCLVRLLCMMGPIV